MHSTSSQIFSDNAPLIRKNKGHEEASFDITAMIDLVFMMNIFFLVTMVTAALNELDLPAAKHCLPVDEETAVVITVLKGSSRDGDARVFLGEGDSGEQLTSFDEQEQRIRAAVDDGMAQGRNTVLIMAEKDVPLREVARTSRIVAEIPKLELKLAVVASN